MISIEEGPKYGGNQCHACGKPQINLKSMRIEENINLWTLSIGHDNHTNSLHLCAECILELNDILYSLIQDLLRKLRNEIGG